MSTRQVCEKCGEEIGGGDADTLCPACNEAEARGRRNARARANRRAREAAIRSLGLVKVRGNLGGTYWE